MELTPQELRQACQVGAELAYRFLLSLQASLPDPDGIHEITIAEIARRVAKAENTVSDTLKTKGVPFRREGNKKYFPLPRVREFFDV